MPMACVAPACGDSPLLSWFHRGKSPRTPPWSAASARGYFPLLFTVHCRKAAWPPVKSPATR
ncbi:MAG TPA: hypothetical protein VNV43_01860 [Candidatus Acidoferrales bacterium]|nr:hypothetical protein [Candidatus Acidoferrales bacterium]